MFELVYMRFALEKTKIGIPVVSGVAFFGGVEQERGMFVNRLVRLDRLSEVHVQSVIKLQLEVRECAVVVDV